MLEVARSNRVNPSPDIWAVVPVKALALAKSRLASDFSPAFRHGLAVAMLEDVLTVLSNSKALAGIIMVSEDAEAAAIGRRYGAEIFTEAADGGHTQAVMTAAHRLAEEKRGGLLTVPGDIPALSEAEIGQLLTRHRDAPAFSIVPAHDRRGSNAIVMTPPLCVPLCFGNDSFGPHLAAARQCGIEPTIVLAPGIGLDIDCPADVARLIDWPKPTRAAAFIESHSSRATAALPLSRSQPR
jgi:2-phospho-L-lactate guanylyltransferase